MPTYAGGNDKAFVIAEDRDAWERQPNETVRHYGRFMYYRDLGPTRTYKRVAQEFKIAQGSVQQYAHRYRWRDRCEAFDHHMDAQWIAALKEHQKRMVRDHLALSRRVLDAATEGLAHTIAAELSPTEIVRLGELYSKLSRVAVGEPDTSVQLTGPGRGPVQLTAVPGDEPTRRAQMEAATAELARRFAAAGQLDEEAVLDVITEDT